MKKTASALLALLVAIPATAQTRFDMLTTPERTKFEETSKYEDVMAFLRAADRASPLIFLDSMGKTIEGRALPLVVVGRVPNASAQAVRATNRLRVYLQGNIHAGEVEGKESLQILLREIASGQHLPWLDSVVLLINPIYNADGNERFDLRNRGTQHGPLKGMGTRPNAMNLNLNRDYMKADAPESKGQLAMFRDYDPHVTVDLHTTNGSQHAYFLTYSPPLHPNTPASIVSLLRERWFPELTRNVKRKYGWDFYYYGNLGGQDSTRGWYTFEHVPRFSNNYAGVRNRIGILSEAYSYARFEDRIKATSYFVNEVLDYSWAHATELKRITEQADRENLVGRTLATRARIDPNGKPVTILLGEVVADTNPYSKARMNLRKDVSIPTPMKEYGVFAATDSAVVGRTYFVPPAFVPKVSPLLTLHNVRTRSLTRDTTVDAQRFRIDSTSVGARPFEGHAMRSIAGAYESARVTMPAGTLVIDMSQPLARLAFLLLEPRSDDGLLVWNFLDPEIAQERYYPIVKTMR